MDYITNYHGQVTNLISRIAKTQKGNIEKAAEILFAQIEADRLIHVFGVGGHSFVGSEEFFYRAGGLANISPIFDLSLSLAGGGQKSTLLERVEGYGDRVIRSHRLSKGNVLVITSAYGMNACTIDAALEAKRNGCMVIAITSVSFAKSTPPGFVARHSSNKNLVDLADVTIDNHIPHGEVVVELDGYPQKVGGTCNILQCFCVNALVIETVDLCLKNNIKPPVWQSANIVGGDEQNENLLEKYTPRVKWL